MFFHNIWNIIDVIGVSLIVALFFVLFFFEASEYIYFQHLYNNSIALPSGKKKI